MKTRQTCLDYAVFFLMVLPEALFPQTCFPLDDSNTEVMACMCESGHHRWSIRHRPINSHIQLPFLKNWIINYMHANVNQPQESLSCWSIYSEAHLFKCHQIPSQSSRKEDCTPPWLYIGSTSADLYGSLIHTNLSRGLVRLSPTADVCSSFLCFAAHFLCFALKIAATL